MGNWRTPSRIRREGRTDHQDGYGLENNPYTPGGPKAHVFGATVLAGLWAEGWHEYQPTGPGVDDLPENRAARDALLKAIQFTLFVEDRDGTGIDFLRAWNEGTHVVDWPEFRDWTPPA